MLREKYEKEIRDMLKKKFEYSNVMEIPKLKRVSINVGLGIVDKTTLDTVVKDLSLIAGQLPVLTRARKSVSNFKLRAGMVVGCKVTLRRDLMYYFLERLINIALPRGRDFKGMKKNSFDGSGNFSFGIREHIIFPEVIHAGVGKIFGMDVTISTTADTDVEALELLKCLGFPFN